MRLFKIFSKDVDKPDSSEEKPKEDYTPKWWVETRYNGEFVVMHKRWVVVWDSFCPIMMPHTREDMRFSTLEEAVAYCEDQIGSYEFKPETVWGPKP